MSHTEQRSSGNQYIALLTLRITRAIIVNKETVFGHQRYSRCQPCSLNPPIAKCGLDGPCSCEIKDGPTNFLAVLTASKQQRQASSMVDMLKSLEFQRLKVNDSVWQGLQAYSVFILRVSHFPPILNMLSLVYLNSAFGNSLSIIRVVYYFCPCRAPERFSCPSSICCQIFVGISLSV